MTVKNHDLTIERSQVRFPRESKTFLFICSMDVVGQPHKQLGAEAFSYVMINTPMIGLTLNIQYKSDGRTWN